MWQQIAAITWMNLQAIPQRLGSSLVIVIGIAGVVAVLVSVLAMATGFSQTLASSGRDDRAMVLRGNAQAEINSAIQRDQALTILDAPGVARDAQGRPVGCGELVTIVNLPKLSDGNPSNGTMRGSCAQLGALRPELKLTQGRMFRPAVRELIAGSGAAQQFSKLTLGSRIAFRDSDWTVVGIFASGGDAHESELFADADTVLSAFRRNAFQSVTLRLHSPATFAGFKQALSANPTLSVDVKRERDYYAQQSEQLSKLLNFIATFVGGIMAVGAMFGALNTMYTAVAARSVEIATLRALGFGPLPVIISVFVESLLLALAGGLLGAALAWAFFNGNAVSTLGANFSQVVFRLTVTPPLVVTGVLLALVIGGIGGLFPALRAARLPVVDALRGR